MIMLAAAYIILIALVKWQKPAVEFRYQKATKNMAMRERY